VRFYLPCIVQARTALVLIVFTFSLFNSGNMSVILIKTKDYIGREVAMRRMLTIDNVMINFAVVLSVKSKTAAKISKPLLR